MTTRRTFITVLGLTPLALAMSGCGDSSDSGSSITDPSNTSNAGNTGSTGNTNSGTTTPPVAAVAAYLMPSEGSAHKATWMCYGATESAWGPAEEAPYGTSRALARKDLMRIAVNLSRYEAVNMIVNSNDMTEAKSVLAQAKLEAAPTFTNVTNIPVIEAGGKITLIEHALNDLWSRDTAPVFVRNTTDNTIAGVNFNFNGWGQENTGAPGWTKDPNKAKYGITDQEIAADKTIADFILTQTNTPKISTWLVMEGGGVEVDGKGTAICTRSCILNPNRNPGKTQADVETELKRALGIKKVIWLDGVKAKDITDGHVDFYARFAGDGKVLCTLDNDTTSPDYQSTQNNLAVLKAATDCDGKPLTVTPLVSPDFSKVQPTVMARNGWTNSKYFNSNGFAAGYVGYYETSKCVLMAQFGDSDADAAALAIIKEAFPDRAILVIATDGIANGGGTIHCSTQQQIA